MVCTWLMYINIYFRLQAYGKRFVIGRGGDLSRPGNKTECVIHDFPNGMTVHELKYIIKDWPTVNQFGAVKVI